MRVIIVNTDEEVAADLRSVLLGVDGVKIVAEIDEPALLAQALDQFPCEALLIHLDPNPQVMMDVVAPLIEANKERIAAIGMTENRDAELVVRAMRAGMREFLWKPFPPEQLGEIISRVAADAPAGRRLGRLVSVVGAAGGVGVTSLATNLAVELAQIEGWHGANTPTEKPKTAVVDLDLRFGQVAMQLDAQPNYTIAELCETPEHIDPQMIDRAMIKHSTGVHILARPNDYEHANGISAGQCAGVLAALQEYYDFVVVDLPTRFDRSSQAVFDMADVCLLLLELCVPTVRNADRMITELGRVGWAVERIQLVCNRVGRESGHLQPADVEATLKRKIAFSVPDEWRTSSTAVNMGVPLLSHAPKSRLRLAYQQMAECFAMRSEMDETQEAASDSSRKSGFFGLFSGSK